jgi:hypothetical protein
MSLPRLKRRALEPGTWLIRAVAEEVQRDPNLKLVDTRHPSILWLEFAEQWDPKSVWTDIRLRQTAIRPSIATPSIMRPVWATAHQPALSSRA